MVPEANVGFVGIARDEDTHQPVPYLESLPDDLSGQPVFVLDPMLATGGPMIHTIELLVTRKASDITAVCVVAAPEGVAALENFGTSGASGGGRDRRRTERRRLHHAGSGRCRGPPVRPR